MHQHIVSGKKGEVLAAGWLSAKGFAILAQNWRHGRYEIDIIASREKVLHVVEVKYRRTTAFGRPEENVNRRKFRHILNAAAEWRRLFPNFSRVQYDVLAITARPGQPIEFLLIEDVYL